MKYLNARFCWINLQRYRFCSFHFSMAPGWMLCPGLSIEPKRSAVGQGMILGGQGANYDPGVAETPISILAGNWNCLACARKFYWNWALKDLRSKLVILSRLYLIQGLVCLLFFFLLYFTFFCQIIIKSIDSVRYNLLKNLITVFSLL